MPMPNWFSKLSSVMLERLGRQFAQRNCTAVYKQLMPIAECLVLFQWLEFSGKGTSAVLTSVLQLAACLQCQQPIGEEMSAACQELFLPRAVQLCWVNIMVQRF